MRLIFMGTPDFALPTLKALIAAGHEIACVYSQPPRPAGRGMGMRPSPVQDFAEKSGLEVCTPLTLKGEQPEADAIVVVAYGLLLPKSVLDAPGLGCFNVHASLLPRWRGAAPIQRAIMAGDAETGVTIMRMEEGLDTGPMCKVGRMAIAPDATAQVLHDALAEMGARLMVETLAEARVTCVPQPETGVAYAKKLAKSEARIDFSLPAVAARNHIHGLSPFPGAWFMSGGTRIKVLACEVIAGSAPPGTFMDDNFAIACGSGALRMLTLQREGKGPMPAAEFLRGLPIASGAVAS